MKDPDIAPSATAQSGFEIRPSGVEVIEQPVSAGAKLVPVTRTFVPARPEVGSNWSPGSTVKLPVPTSKSMSPVRVKVYVPGVVPVATTKGQVMVPPLAAVQAMGARPTGVPAIVDKNVSAVLKPVPVTVIDAPTGPEAGDAVTTCGITPKVAEATPAVTPPPPVTVIV
jgi:hypothetical protein